MDRNKNTEWAITAPAIDVGPACSNVEVPSTIVMDEEFREPYVQGYRHALSDARHYFEGKKHPLLQCIDCKNTESTAGAMARAFNQGRCICGGYFKVVQA